MSNQHGRQRVIHILTVCLMSIFLTADCYAQVNSEEFASAIGRGDLAALRNLVENRGANVNAPLSITKSGNNFTPLYRASLSFIGAVMNNAPYPTEIFRYLLGHCANPNIYVDAAPSQNYKEPLLQYLERNYQSLKGYGSAKQPQANQLLEIINLVKQYQSNSNCSNGAPLEDVNISQWVSDFPIGNSRVINVRNNSEKRSVRIKSLNVYNCVNVMAGLCGESAWASVILEPGASTQLRSVQPSQLTQAFSFDYIITAGFEKGPDVTAGNRVSANGVAPLTSPAPTTAPVYKSRADEMKERLDEIFGAEERARERAFRRKMASLNAQIRRAGGTPVDLNGNPVRRTRRKKRRH